MQKLQGTGEGRPDILRNSTAPLAHPPTPTHPRQPTLEESIDRVLQMTPPQPSSKAFFITA